jgi:hypothetical protein
MKFILFITTFSISLLSFNVAAVKISSASHEILTNGQVAINFNLSETANTQINIYDDRDYLIRSIIKGKMEKGDQSIIWDLKDKESANVPPEAYKYTIEAAAVDGERIVHDLSDITGSNPVKVSDVHLNKVTGNVEFTLQKPSRVLIRAGLSGGGPLLVTLANWVAKRDGKNSVSWNGLDASKVINIRNHDKLYFDIQAYTFSDNTIIVGKNNSTVKLIDTSSWKVEKRKNIVHKKKRMIAAYQQSPETRGDFVVNLDIAQQNKTKNNTPIVDGVIPVKLSVNKDNMSTIMNRRAEPVFYIDGKFSYENEVGFYPMIWKLDTRNLNAGEHYLTVNLRGYDGNFGIASKKILVEHDK